MTLSCHQRTRSLVKALGLSVVLLLTHNFNAQAQDGPPLPGTGDTKPRELTLEEREAMRRAQEERWRKNREVFAPYLHEAPPPEPVDPVLRQRLMSAELVERERKISDEIERDKRLLEWAAEQHQRSKNAKGMVDRLASREVKEFFENQGMELTYRDGRITLIKSMNANVARSISTWKAKTNAPIDYPLNVNGQIVGLWEISVPGTNHAELNNGGIARLIYIDDTASNTNNRPHATEMAGTMAAFGVMTNAEGMASATTILASDTDDHIDEMATNSVLYGIRLSNHSYGTGQGWHTLADGLRLWLGPENQFYDDNFGSYKETAALVDGMAYLQPGYLSVWAAGNDRNNANWSGLNHFHNDLTVTNDSHAADNWFYGGYQTITPEGTAKNVITVGSIFDLPNGWQNAAGVTNSPFSNWGPTRDGRLKPEIVSNGQDVYSSSSDINGNDTYSTESGTSPATASVTGSIALLRERFHQVGIGDPSASLIKALVLATADEAGNPGPDYQFGYGVMNTDQAASLILTNTYFANSAGGLLRSHFIDGVLTNGTTWEIAIHKNQGTTLKAMLVWTDPAGAFSAGATNLMRVNDLDLEILHSGATNQSFVLTPSNPPLLATRGDNTVDNTELNVWHDDDMTGQFTIRVKHKGTIVNSPVGGATTNQPFALVVSGHIVEPVPHIVSIAQTSGDQVSLAWTGQLFKSYKVQYIDEVDALASAWIDATGSILMQTNPAAVALTMPTNAPERFYRVVRP